MIILCEVCGFLGAEDEFDNHANHHIYDDPMPEIACLGHHGEAFEEFMDQYTEPLSENEDFEEWLDGAVILLREFVLTKYSEVRNSLAGYRETADIYINYLEFQALNRIRKTPCKAEDFFTWDQVMGEGDSSTDVYDNEKPDCEHFQSMYDGAANVCKGNAPYSCDRSQKEGLCHKRNEVKE